MKTLKKKSTPDTEERGFQDTPRGWARRWKKEFEIARGDERFKAWQEEADDIDKFFRDERDSKSTKSKRINLYPSNVQMQRAMMYGKAPSVSVERKFADAADDVARVAGEELDRLLNCENEREDDTFNEAVGYALQDFQNSGLGIVRVRYEYETETVEAVEAQVDPMTGAVLAEGIEAHERKVNEDAPVDWVHWKEFLWSKCKVWHRARWIAFLAEMTNAEVTTKFGKEIAEALSYGESRKDDDNGKEAPWGRARIWEIWNKDTESVFFFNEAHSSCLTQVGLPEDSILPNGSQKDPLGLDGFWPAPRPLLANTTTSTLVPVPDYHLARDQYQEVNELATRIYILVDAIGVKGAYDSTAKALEQLLKTRGNVLVPVDDWAMQAEKGGSIGRIEWFPLEQVAKAILSLEQQRQQSMDLIFQVTGQSDLMRGQQTQNGTPGEAQIKAKSASIRMQQQQEEFARFCTDIQRLRAQVIAKHFDAETIVRRSNMMMTTDAQLAQPAAELIKSNLASYRIEIKPEAVSMSDFSAMRQESMEVLGGLTTFMQALGSISQVLPGSTPGFLKLLQASLARVKGASALESITDEMIKTAEQAQQQQQGQPPPPSPEQMKLQAVQMKGQMDLQREQVKQQGDMMRIQAEVQADGQREQTQAMWNTREAAAKAQISAATKAAQPAPIMPRRIR